MCSAVVFTLAVVFFVGLPVNRAVPAPPAIVEWPAECEGRSYCSKKPSNYPGDLFEKLLMGAKMEVTQNGGMENRTGGINVEDVASCMANRSMHKIYMIKDENEKMRFVAQTETFHTQVQVEECLKPGRTLKSKLLLRSQLKKNEVDCVETKVPMQFLVLSLDGFTLESVAPQGGIPSSCSAKIMEVNKN